MRFIVYLVKSRKTKTILEMKTILITQFTLLFFVIPNFGWAQFVTVSGYVNHGTNGKALENVSIFEANSGIGTITNQNGFYKLTLEKGDLNLKVSNNGFSAFQQNLKLSSDTTLVVKLQPNLHSKVKNRKDDELHAGSKAEKKSENRQGFKFF